ncbi:MAG: hypothetical protein AB7E52_03075 [Bdellovibrionales bacterium]
MPLNTAITKILLNSSPAFIQPWKDKERTKILLAGIIGSFCFGAQSFALDYELGGLDLKTSLTFQILRFSLLGFVGIPTTFWLMAKDISPKHLFLIQFIGSLLYFIDPHSGFISAIAYTLSLSPFCAVYNYNFAVKQTDQNRNNETALAQYTLVISSCLGIFSGGWLLSKGYYLLAIFIGCAGGACATYIMRTPLPQKNYAARTRIRLGWRKPSNRITFMTSMNGVLIDSCLPIWMNVIGLSPLTASANMAVRPFLGFFLTPLFGFIMKRGTFEAARYVTILLATGWFFMMNAYFWPTLIPVAMAVLMAATNLMAPMEMNRWFKRRSVSATIAREGLFAIGRIPAYLIGIPVIFTAPIAFPILGLSIGTLFAYGLIYRRKKWTDRLKFWQRPQFAVEKFEK